MEPFLLIWGKASYPIYHSQCRILLCDQKVSSPLPSFRRFVVRISCLLSHLSNVRRLLRLENWCIPFCNFNLLIFSFFDSDFFNSLPLTITFILRYIAFFYFYLFFFFDIYEHYFFFLLLSFPFFSIKKHWIVFNVRNDELRETHVICIQCSWWLTWWKCIFPFSFSFFFFLFSLFFFS